MLTGITSFNPVWQQLLDQERVFSTLISPERAFPSEKIPVLIYAQKRLADRVMAEQHLQNGGALVCDLSVGVEDFNRYQKQIFKIPLNLGQILNSHEYVLKDFVFGSTTVQETAAKLSKSQARKAMVQALKLAFWSKGLPYAHLWYYPKKFRSLFSFRFDMDEFNPNDHAVFLNLLRESRGATSCFACMKTYEKNQAALKQVVETGVELASHGYIHHIYHNDSQNNWNLEQAENFLQDSAGKITGFSAPHGKWHPALQTVLERRGYEYSSEFCLDYDNLPFFPYHQGRFSPVLQIPTHPVCEGVFLEKYDYKQAMFEDYYSAVIKRQIQNHDPLIIFGHPTKRLGRYPEIFRFIQRKVRAEKNVWLAEFREICRWWKKRHALQYELSFQNGALYSNHLDHDFEIHYQFQDQVEGWADSEALSMGIKSDLRGSEQIEVVTDTYLQEKETQKTWIQRQKAKLKLWLDWETKTPVAALKIVDLPTLIKKLMRIVLQVIKPGISEGAAYGA